MIFLHPILAAVGAACVAVPILIHLLMRRRRRPVVWAAMRFILEAVRQQRRRLRLEQFLLLAARCLLVLLVAAAIARPILSGGSALSGRSAITLYLLIDDSLTSSAREGPASALDRHKAAAADLLKQLDPAAGDRAGLVLLSAPAQPLVLPASAGVGAVAGLVRDLEPTDAAADLPGAIAALAGLRSDAAPPGRTVVAVLSDFLTGSADIERPLGQLPASLRPTTILITDAARMGPDNVTITGVEPLRPVVVTGADAATQAPVRVSLRRTGPGVGVAAPGLVTLRITAPGQAAVRAAGQGQVRWAAGQSTAEVPVDLSVPAGATGSLVLTATADNDAIASDNTFRRAVEARGSLRVALIASRPLRAGASTGIQKFEPADWFRVALDPATGSPGAPHEIEVIDLDPASIDAPRVSGIDAAIVLRPDAVTEPGWRHLRTLVDEGGLLVVAPPPDLTVHLWADAMTAALGLEWTIAREARTYPEGAPLRDETQRQAVLPSSRDLLRVLAPELPELVKPVRVFRVLPVQQTAGGNAPPPLLALADGTPLLLAASPGSTAEAAGRGIVVFLAAPPSFDWTDLQARPLMLPLMQEVIRMGVARARAGSTMIAGAVPSLPPRATELRPVEGESRAPLARGGPIRRSGVFEALDDRGGARGLLTVNADPAAGRTDPQPVSAIATWLASCGGTVHVLGTTTAEGAEGSGALRQSIDHGGQGSGWSLGLLIAALGVALAELAMARWFSHARVEPGESR
ncbi:MAG: BatA domain-containing protein [Phycisphaerales bacterium]|nr:BatA domain-containing protein [Phycisphaerales bacterium]